MAKLGSNSGARISFLAPLEIRAGVSILAQRLVQNGVRCFACTVRDAWPTDLRIRGFSRFLLVLEDSG
jgi:hypothetical protein